MQAAPPSFDVDVSSHDDEEGGSEHEGGGGAAPPRARGAARGAAPEGAGSAGGGGGGRRAPKLVHHCPYAACSYTVSSVMSTVHTWMNPHLEGAGGQQRCDFLPEPGVADNHEWVAALISPDDGPGQFGGCGWCPRCHVLIPNTPLAARLHNSRLHNGVAVARGAGGAPLPGGAVAAAAGVAAAAAAAAVVVGGADAAAVLLGGGAAAGAGGGAGGQPHGPGAAAGEGGGPAPPLPPMPLPPRPARPNRPRRRANLGGNSKRAALLMHEAVAKFVAAAELTERIAAQGPVGSATAPLESPEGQRRAQILAQDDIAALQISIMGALNGTLHPRGNGGVAGGHSPPTAPVTEGELRNRRFKRAIKALRHIRSGGIRRALRFLTSKAPPAHIDQAFMDESIKPLFPPLMGDTLDDLLPAAYAACANADANVEFSIEAVGKYINSRRDDAAAGASGLAPRTLKRIWNSSNIDQQSALCLFLQRIANGYVPEWWSKTRVALARVRGIAISKAPKSGYRPIGVGEILSVVADGVLAAACREVFTEVCGGNLAIFVKRGAEAMAHCARAVIEADDCNTIVALDSANAFGTVSRRSLISRLTSLIQSGNVALRPVLRRALQIYTSPSFMDFRGAAGETFTVEVKEGNIQGTPLAIHFYTIVHTEGLEDFWISLPPVVRARSQMLALADDTDLAAKDPADIPVLIQGLQTAMAKRNIRIQPTKTSFFRTRTGDEGHEQLCAYADSIGVRYRTLADSERGISVCGAYLGTVEFQRAKLQGRVDSIGELLHEFEDMTVLADAEPPVDGSTDRTIQAAYTAIRLCVPSRLAYWGGIMHPHIFRQFADAADDLTADFVLRLLQVRTQDSTLVGGVGIHADQLRHKATRLLLALPTGQGGCALQTNGGLQADAAYIASFSEAIPIIAHRVGAFVCLPQPQAGEPGPLLPSVTDAARSAIHRLRNGRPELTADLSSIQDSLNTTFHPERHDTLECLRSDINECNLQSLFALGSSSAWTRHKLRSMACPTASAWMNLIPQRGMGTTMTNRNFCTASGNRLCIDPTPGGQRCGWCASRATPVHVIMDDAHALLCPGPSFNGEHHGVRDAIAKAIRNVARGLEDGELHVATEAPLDAALCVERLTNQERLDAARGLSLNNKPRIVNMDLWIQHQEEEGAPHQHLLIDVNFSSPEGRWKGIPADDPITRKLDLDHFTDAAAKEKIFRFDTSFRYAQGERTRFLPLTLDRTGRPSAAAATVIKSIKKILDLHSRSSESKYSAGQALVDRISVAAQTGIARRIQAARQLHLSCIAAAAAQDGAGGPGGGPGAVAQAAGAPHP